MAGSSGQRIGFIKNQNRQARFGVEGVVLRLNTLRQFGEGDYLVEFHQVRE
jgi:hypothetical protein